MLCILPPRHVWLVGITSLLSVPNAECVAFSDPMQLYKTHSVIRALYAHSMDHIFPFIFYTMISH